MVKDLKTRIIEAIEKVFEENFDPGPCYRCHMWPCSCKEGPLMEKPEKQKEKN